METTIIQHHKSVDFESLFETIRSQCIGLDYQDCLTFLHADDEKHSFIGEAECKGRVENALRNAIASDESVEIINRASNVMVTVIRSCDADCPLTMEEMQCINEFNTGFSDNCDVVLRLAEDSTLGNAVKVVVLANVNP